MPSFCLGSGKGTPSATAADADSEPVADGVNLLTHNVQSISTNRTSALYVARNSGKFIDQFIHHLVTIQVPDASKNRQTPHFAQSGGLDLDLV
jgi:hypothetical protein